MEIRNCEEYVLNRVHELEEQNINLLKEYSESLKKSNEILEEYCQLKEVLRDIIKVNDSNVPNLSRLSFENVWEDNPNYSILKGILNI